jgi:hypothetical protein
MNIIMMEYLIETATDYADAIARALQEFQTGIPHMARAAITSKASASVTLVPTS